MSLIEFNYFVDLLIQAVMTEMPQDLPTSGSESPSPRAEIDSQSLLTSLRRKQGTWVEWGQACQKLQKAGYTPQTIFEETGFEPIHQNQVIVGSQVYTGLVDAAAPIPTLEHFERKGSDILYEFRILTQTERLAAAEFVVAKNLDLDSARDLAKAIKEWSRLNPLPAGFSALPGDVLAYQCWKVARQKSDLQERARLIARGLSLTQSETAREQLEKLLTDFTVIKTHPAPRWPFYQLESDDELPRVLPLVGQFPLTPADLRAIPLIEEIGPFQVVRFSGECAWVPVPGWQVIQNAEDAVGLLCESRQLPDVLPGKPGEVLVIIDRAQRQWQADSYFVIEREGQLQFQWFEAVPETPLLGRVILVMRPKKIFDEDVAKDPWQIDE